MQENDGERQLPKRQACTSKACRKTNRSWESTSRHVQQMLAAGLIRNVEKIHSQRFDFFLNLEMKQNLSQWDMHKDAKLNKSHNRNLHTPGTRGFPTYLAFQPICTVENSTNRIQRGQLICVCSHTHPGVERQWKEIINNLCRTNQAKHTHVGIRPWPTGNKPTSDSGLHYCTWDDSFCLQQTARENMGNSGLSIPTAVYPNGVARYSSHSRLLKKLNLTAVNTSHIEQVLLVDKLDAQESPSPTNGCLLLKHVNIMSKVVVTQTAAMKWSNTTYRRPNYSTFTSMSYPIKSCYMSDILVLWWTRAWNKTYLKSVGSLRHIHSRHFPKLGHLGHGMLLKHGQYRHNTLGMNQHFQLITRRDQYVLHILWHKFTDVCT